MLDKGLFFEKQYQNSVEKGTFKIYHEYEEYDDSFYLGTISGQLKCNKPECNSILLIFQSLGLLLAPPS